MQKDKKVRLSICMEASHHKILKVHCANMGVSITDFVMKSLDRIINFHVGELKDGIDQ